MKAFLIGFAVMTGPAIAWHMRAVSRRWDTPDHPSRPAANPAAGASPDLDGPTRARREDHRP